MLLGVPIMDTMAALLETAEFEALWLEARYHEGRATVADVENAIRQVNELRKLAATLASRRTAGFVFPWRPAEAVTSAGN